VSVESDELSLVSVVNFCLSYRRLIVGLAAGACLATTLVVLLRSRTYTALASFMPQSRSATASLSGIAAQLGLVVPTAGGEGFDNAALYPDLLESRAILDSILPQRITISADTGMVDGTLEQLLRVRGRDEPGRREAAVARLRSMISARVVSRTGVVEFTVRAPQAALAKLISEKLLAQVSRFNLGTRQSRAAAERRFVERRLEEARTELRGAENRLQAFLQRNRQYLFSPELRFEQERLAREVAVQQEVYTTLAQAYEQARIEEVRDTPVLTVIERPIAPVRADRRHLVTLAMFATIVGAILGVLVGLGRFLVRGWEVSGLDELERYALLKREAVEDLRHPLRWALGGWRPR